MGSGLYLRHILQLEQLQLGASYFLIQLEDCLFLAGDHPPQSFKLPPLISVVVARSLVARTAVVNGFVLLM